MGRLATRSFLPYRTKEKLRKYAGIMFHSDKLPVSRRRYTFYLILRDSLDWVRAKLKELELEENEIESEIFLLTADLFGSYRKTKMSIVPYVEKHITWRAARVIERHEPNTPPVELYAEPNSYEIDSEFYLTSPEFIFETSWIARHLSQSQKNLILKVLTTDSTSIRNLANECRLSKSNVATQLQDIATVLQGRL